MSQPRLAVSADNRKRHRAAARWLRSLPSLSRVLLLSSNRGAADDFARDCCLSQGALWGLDRMTPFALAGAIATERMAEKGLSPLGQLAMEALAARAIHACRKRAPLSYFEPVADMPGFPRAVARTLRELRLDRTPLEKLKAGGGGGSDLAALLTEYQTQLESGRLADSAATFENAAAALREGGFELPQAVLFFDISPRSVLEWRLLDAVRAQRELCFATVLRGDEAAAAAWTQRLGPAGEGEGAQEPSRVSLGSVRRWIFSPELGEERDADDSVQFFSAPGEGRECVEIARRIRRICSQVPLDRTAILLRDPMTYLPLVEEALNRARLPAYYTRGTVRPEPAGRAFLALLACTAEGLSAGRFAEYLSLGQVPAVEPDGSPQPVMVPWAPPQEGQLSFMTPREPEEGAPQDRQNDAEDHDSPAIAGTFRTPRHWEQLLTDAAVIGGVDRWRRRLSGLEAELAKRAQAAEAEDSTRAERIRADLELLRCLERFALPLIGRMADLPAEAAWGLWLPPLRELAAHALRWPESVLAVLAELTPMEEVGPVSLHEVRQVLTERLTTLRTDPPPRRSGRVFVGTIEDAAGRSFQWVFLPGLAEGTFPRKAFEDPLLLDECRAAVSPTLPGRDDRFIRERILLRMAMGAAAETLVVSYPRVDAVNGRPRVPSFYALEVLRAAEGRLPDLKGIEKRAAQGSSTRLGWPAPDDPLSAIDDAEHDLAVLEPLLRRAENSVQGWARYLMEVNPHLARSLRTRARRWRNFWSEADGIVNLDDATLRLLESQRLRRRGYSPTALEQYAVCPYRFVLHAIHYLRPREEAVALERMDPLTRGSLFHEVQFNLHQRLKSLGLLPMTEENRSRLLDLADEVLENAARSFEEELAPAIPRVWAGEIEDIRRDLRGWIRQVCETGGGWRPLFAEFSFGLKDRGSRDPASRESAAEILSGLHLRGAIDLVEESLFSGNLRVVDHKTGRTPSPEPRWVAGGEHLQPLLYALAAESLLGREVEAGQLFYCTHRGGYRRLDFPLNQESREMVRRVLATIDREIERGFLPAAPREKACQYCDFRAVCGPYEEMRVSRKLRPALKALDSVRSLQ